MSERVRSAWMDAEIVTLGERPGVLVDSAIRLSTEEAALRRMRDFHLEDNPGLGWGSK